MDSGPGCGGGRACVRTRKRYAAFTAELRARLVLCTAGGAARREPGPALKAELAALSVRRSAVRTNQQVTPTVLYSRAAYRSLDASGRGPSSRHSPNGYCRGAVPARARAGMGASAVLQDTTGSVCWRPVRPAPRLPGDSTVPSATIVAPMGPRMQAQDRRRKMPAPTTTNAIPAKRRTGLGGRSSRCS